jgi:exopolysaccharide biosynthesis protein
MAVVGYYFFGPGMMRFWVCAWMATTAIAATVRADEPATRPLNYRHEVRADPPLQLHIITVDLADPAVHVKVSHGGNDPKLAPPWETTLMTVSEMARRDGLSAGVNGNYFIAKDTQTIMGRTVPYFAGNWARACGWAMSDGALYSPRPYQWNRPALIVDADGKIAIGQFTNLPPGTRQAVAGLAQIVTDGRNTAPWDPGPPPGLAPHTAAGIDKAGKTLILFVVDGRRPQYSVGMTASQTAAEMIRLGAWKAIMLDGGGSSTMVMRDAAGQPQLMNLPSDGHDLPIAISVERPVDDALGVIVDDPVSRPAKP